MSDFFSYIFLGVANILPQTARPFGQLPGSPTMAKGVQTGQLKQVMIWEFGLIGVNLTVVNLLIANYLS